MVPRPKQRKIHMTKKLAVLAIAIATMTSAAFAASSGVDAETVLRPSPVLTGGASVGYEITQQNPNTN
jgi:hypothetical protein